MARYIDADKLKDEFCEACSTNKRYHLSVEECRGKERPHHKWCFKMRLIDETPTADVAPRAEVNKLEYTLAGVMHSVDKWLDGDELKQDEVNRAITMREKTLRIVENARAEVAKDIFEEIMTEIKRRCLSVEGLAEDNDNEEYYAGCADAYCRIGGYISDIKKKYTGGDDHMEKEKT
jgi:hypothetical protein